MKIDKATACMSAWKNREQEEYAVRLVMAGLAQLDAGRDYFGPDDIPEDTASGYGQYLPGIVSRTLQLAGLLVPYEKTKIEEGIKFGRRKSKHESRNGAKIQLYSLLSRSLAEAFLKRKSGLIVEKQMVLAM